MNMINCHIEEAFGPDYLLVEVIELFLIDFSYSSPEHFASQDWLKQTSYSSYFITKQNNNK